jgi:hypothetical protein
MTFVKGLAELNPELNKVLDAQQRIEQDREEALAAKKFAEMDPTKLDEAVKNGTIPEFQLPWFKPAFMKLYGVQKGQERAVDMMQRYETDFDKDGGNIDQFIHESTQADVQNLDRFALDGYNQVVDRASVTLKQKHAEHTAELVQEGRDNGVGAAIDQTLSLANKTPEQIETAFTSQRDDLKRLFPSMENRDFDRILVDRLKNRVTNAESLTAGDYNLVKYLLTSDRNGVGSIGNINKYRDTTVAILNVALDKYRKGQQERGVDTRVDLETKAHLGQYDKKAGEAAVASKTITPAEHENYLVTNNLALENLRKEQSKLDVTAAGKLVSDEFYNQKLAEALSPKGKLDLKPERLNMPDGSVEDVSVDQQKQQIVARFLQRGPSDNDKVLFFTRTGLVNPEWQDKLQRGGLMLTPEAVANQAPQDLLEAHGLYQTLYARAPGYTMELLGGASNPATARYEATRVLMQSGYKPEQALRLVATAYADPAKTQSSGNFKDTMKRLNKAADDLRDNKFLGWFGGDTGRNRDYAADSIRKNLNVYAMVGINDKEALKGATDMFKASHKVVNGYWVEVPNSIGNDFSKLAEQRLDQIATDYNKDPKHAHKLKGSDLYLMSMAGGADGTVFQVMEDVNGVPFPVSGQVVTPTMLSNVREQNRQAVLADVAKDQGKGQAHRAAEAARRERFREEHPKIAQAADNMRKGDKVTAKVGQALDQTANVLRDVETAIPKAYAKGAQGAAKWATDVAGPAIAQGLTEFVKPHPLKKRKQ